MLTRNNVKKTMDLDVAVSDKMLNAIGLWTDMFENTPPWTSDTCKPRNIPAVICGRVSRYVMIENAWSISGNTPMAAYLTEQFKPFMNNIKDMIAKMCALGGIVIKPYVLGDRIVSDIVDAGSFFPVQFDKVNGITAAVFPEYLTQGKVVYTRIEYHKWEIRDDVHKVNEMGEEIHDAAGNPILETAGVHTIINRAFRKESMQGQSTEDVDDLGKEVPLTAVPEWESITPEIVFSHIDRPMFVYISTPVVNNIDKDSPLGASIYSMAVPDIRDADERWNDLSWEYKATQAAVFVSDDLIRPIPIPGTGTAAVANGTVQVPSGDPFGRAYNALNERQKRLYQIVDIDDGQDKKIQPYSPTIRDQSILNGYQATLRKIEFDCSLSYGMISDPNQIEKTATEIKSSKQTFYALVDDLQSKNLGPGLEATIYIYHALALLYHLAPEGKAELTISWGDGILEDSDKEYQRRWQMVLAGKLKPEKFMAWYFGVDEETALSMMPGNTTIPAEE
jgi:hypothetical protein